MKGTGRSHGSEMAGVQQVVQAAANVYWPVISQPG